MSYPSFNLLGILLIKRLESYFHPDDSLKIPEKNHTSVLILLN